MDIFKDLYSKNLDNIPYQCNILGDKVEDRSMKARLGFLPTSLWKPDIYLTKTLKGIIDDNAQVRKTLNGNRSDRRNGVNGGKVSVFNPHLAQMIISAYCPLSANIIDQFGGGGTRGFIATSMGHKYTGIEIREEEVSRIKEKMNDWNLDFNLILGDAVEYKLQDETYNFSFTCPPYFDLELYSEIENDLSNSKSYANFLELLKKVLTNNFNSLKKGSFSVWVVGNFRNSKGELEHLNGDLIKTAKDVGFKLWDEIIWQGASNVAMTRCGKFEKNRKCVRMHEYVIILKK